MAQIVCFGIDSIPEMTSQLFYPQVSLCTVFNLTGRKIFLMDINIEKKKVFDVHIRMPFRLNQANKKLTVIYTLK